MFNWLFGRKKKPTQMRAGVLGSTYRPNVEGPGARNDFLFTPVPVGDSPSAPAYDPGPAADCSSFDGGSCGDGGGGGGGD